MNATEGAGTLLVGLTYEYAIYVIAESERDEALVRVLTRYPW